MSRVLTPDIWTSQPTARLIQRQDLMPRRLEPSDLYDKIEKGRPIMQPSCQEACRTTNDNYRPPPACSLRTPEKVKRPRAIIFVFPRRLSSESALTCAPTEKGREQVPFPPHSLGRASPRLSPPPPPHLYQRALAVGSFVIRSCGHRKTTASLRSGRTGKLTLCTSTFCKV